MTHKNTINLDIPAFNEHLARWMQVAKDNGWYHEPFHIQVWVDLKGHIVNSVAQRDLPSHYAFDADTDWPIGTFKITTKRKKATQL